MAQVTFKGNPVHLKGELPKVGASAPAFKLTTSDLQDVSLSTYDGKKKILNIVPSLDTSVCATSAKKFNQAIAQLDNVVCLTISNDLPFAQKRFCDAEGVKNVVTLSQLRDRTFGAAYGVEMTDGPLAGLLGRAVVVVDEHNNIVYTELVPEIAQEPNYDKALQAVK